jgi:alpha-mannosidase
MSSSGNGFGLTLSSSVVAMDYQDPTDKGLKNTILQPILLASRRSCHGEGNDYHQTGHHHYSFSITSHQPGWKNGVHFGKEANEKLFSVVDPERYAHARLKEKTTFMKVKQDNIFETAMKKTEDGEGLALRYYNFSGQASDVELSLWKNFKEAFRTNLIEEKKEKLQLNDNMIHMDVDKYGIETIKLK